MCVSVPVCLALKNDCSEVILIVRLTPQLQELDSSPESSMSTTKTGSNLRPLSLKELTWMVCPDN